MSRMSEIAIRSLFTTCCALVGCDTALRSLTPEEQAYVNTMSEAFAALKVAASDFEAIAATGAQDPVSALIAALSGKPGISKVERSSDGVTVIITLENGEVVAVMTDAKNRTEWQTLPTARQILPDPWTVDSGPRTYNAGDRKAAVNASSIEDDFIICEESSYPQSRKACVVINFQSLFKTNPANITEPLTHAGFEVTLRRLDSFDAVAALWNELSMCGVLYISSHGALSRTNQGLDANVISTEIEAGDIFNQTFDMFGHFSLAQVRSFFVPVAEGGHVYWGLTPAFFASANYPNSFVFIDACQSDALAVAGGQLRDAFIGNGAGFFLGWASSVSSDLANFAASAVFNGLAPNDIGVTAIELVTDPNKPGAGQSYEPLVQLTPPLPGVEVRLHVIGSDGFRRSEAKMSDGGGFVRFSSIPGGSSGVEDIITVVTGGPQNGASAVDVARRSNPVGIQKLPWGTPVTSAALLATLGAHAHPSFNLACNNPDTTQSQKIIKF